MRILWTVFKVMFGIALAISAGVLALALVAGAVGTLIGLAALAIRLAFIGLVAYGVYRVARFVFGPSRKVSAPPVRELPAVDPYYEAAMRELDAHMGGRSRG